MALFMPAFWYMIPNEGGYVDDRSDPGGATNFGVSLRFMRTIDPSYVKADIENLSIDDAKEIYQKHFWKSYMDAIENQDLTNYLFDMIVNMGEHESVKLLQHAIWAVSDNTKIVLDDGILGPNTLKWANTLGDKILPCLRALRAEYYNYLARSNKALRKYLSGWIKRTYKQVSLEREPHEQTL